MKKLLFLLPIFCMPIFSMETPQETRGKKRFEPELPEAVEQALQRAKIEQELFEPMEIEPIAQAPQEVPDIEMTEVPELIAETIPEWELPGAPPKYRKISGGGFETKQGGRLLIDPTLAALAPEIKTIIFNYLFSASGITNAAKLANAAENIRNAARTNKAFAQFLQQSNGIKIIVTELANRYAYGNIVEAAIVFGTVKWLQNYIENQKDPDIKTNLEDQVLTLARNAIKDKKWNVFFSLWFNFEELLKSKEITLKSVALKTIESPTKIAHKASSLHFLQSVSAEIKNYLLHDMLKTRGATKETRLSNAAQNIHNFAFENKEFAQLLFNPDAIHFIIIELANNFANGNIPKAGLFLGLANPDNEVIGQWLTDYVKNNFFINDTGKTAIELFASETQKGELAALHYLIKYFPFLTEMPIWSDSTRPLPIATKNGHLAVIKWLLTIPSIRAQINETNEKLRTPLMEAARNGYKDIAQILIDAGANIHDMSGGSTPLHNAVFGGNSAIVDLLIKRGVDLEVHDDHQENTALILASYYGDIEIVKLLLDAGANPNLFDEEQKTALSHAADKGYLEIVKLLINAHAAIDTQNENGHTPLMFAARAGHAAIVEFLIRNHAQINMRDNEGNTALHLAIKEGHPHVVKLLLNAGALTTIPNEQEMTPLMLAQRTNNPNKEAIIKLLRDKGATE